MFNLSRDFLNRALSMCILRSLCVYFDLYVYTLISMCILRSLCVYFDHYDLRQSPFSASFGTLCGSSLLRSQKQSIIRPCWSIFSNTVCILVLTKAKISKIRPNQVPLHGPHGNTTAKIVLQYSVIGFVTDVQGPTFTQ